MSKTNLYASIFIGLVATCFIVYELTNTDFVWSLSITYAIILIIIGEAVASTTITNIENIVYIRSEEEAIKTALPRIPFKVKKALIFIPINLTILIITASAAYYFLDESMKFNWFIVLLLPLAIHLLSLIPYFLLKDDGFVKSKKKALEDDDRHTVIINIGKKLANKNSKSCRKTNTDQYQTILHYLKNGQNPDEVFEDRYTLLLPSSCCGDYKLAKSLIEHGSDVNFKSSLGMTALILACKHGFYDIASLLLENGADVNEKDLEGKTALFYAEQYDFKDIVEILNQSPQVQL